MDIFPQFVHCGVGQESPASLIQPSIFQGPRLVLGPPKFYRLKLTLQSKPSRIGRGLWETLSSALAYQEVQDSFPTRGFNYSPDNLAVGFKDLKNIYSALLVFYIERASSDIKSTILEEMGVRSFVFLKDK